MTIDEIINSLEEQAIDKEEFVDKDDPDCIFRKDIEVLRCAANMLRAKREAAEMAQHKKEICRAALDKWGAEAQTLMVFEEMSELQKELCKHARGKDNREEIAEEIADVEIMLEQMKILHDCRREVAKFKKMKLERLKGRILGNAT